MPHTCRSQMPIGIGSVGWTAPARTVICIAKFGYSFEDLVGAPQDRGRDCQPECGRCLQVDSKLVMGRLFDRQIARRGAVENLRDVMRHSTPQLGTVWAIAQQTAGMRRLGEFADRRQPRFKREPG